MILHCPSIVLQLSPALLESHDLLFGFHFPKLIELGLYIHDLPGHLGRVPLPSATQYLLLPLLNELIMGLGP